MFRKRERFERTDVPGESPYRNVVGAVVCVVALALTAVIVSLVWNRVQLESNLGDTGLAGALDDVGDVAATADGLVPSTDDRELTLLLVTDDLGTGGSLTSARILSVNHTKGTAGFINLSTEVAVATDEGHVALSQLFSSQGYAACVDPLAQATGIAFDHVVVSTTDFVTEAASLAGTDAAGLVRTASDLLGKIRTDMDAATLVSLAGSISQVGLDNITAFDAPVVADVSTDADGNATETGLQAVDTVGLATYLGLLVPAA